MLFSRRSARFHAYFLSSSGEKWTSDILWLVSRMCYIGRTLADRLSTCFRLGSSNPLPKPRPFLFAPVAASCSSDLGVLQCYNYCYTSSVLAPCGSDVGIT